MVLLDTETPGTSREIYSEDAEGEARTRNPWITNPDREHKNLAERNRKEQKAMRI